MATGSECSDFMEPCIESGCCKQPGDGCYKRPSKFFAQCRPLVEDGPCISSEDWLCPGTWTLEPPSFIPVVACAERYSDCRESRCCEYKIDECQKRVGKDFAMCKPITTTTCEDDEDWLCPESWMIPPPPPKPPATAPPPLLGATSQLLASSAAPPVAAALEQQSSSGAWLWVAVVTVAALGGLYWRHRQRLKPHPVETADDGEIVDAHDGMTDVSDGDSLRPNHI